MGSGVSIGEADLQELGFHHDLAISNQNRCEQNQDKITKLDTRKIKKNDMLLREYIGREHVLICALRKKYGDSKEDFDNEIKCQRCRQYVRFCDMKAHSVRCYVHLKLCRCKICAGIVVDTDLARHYKHYHPVQAESLHLHQSSNGDSTSRVHENKILAGFDVVTNAVDEYMSHSNGGERSWYETTFANEIKQLRVIPENSAIDNR